MNGNEKLVSIIMATYNGEEFVSQQIDSVLKQTYSNTEIIIVDDCSTDKTQSILKMYAEHNKKIRLYFNETRLGYVKNFEKGCGLAAGNYISFCDQDDVWHPDKTTLLMQALNDNVMVYCDDDLVDENLNSLQKKHSDLKQLNTFDNCLYFATDNCVGGHALIMQKKVFERSYPFPKEMPYDLWCAFNATFFGEIKYYNKPLVQWRQHTKNITGLKGNKKEKIEETKKRFELFYNACPPAKVYERNVLKKLRESYEDFSLKNDFLRMNIFFQHKHYLLAMKKRNEVRKFLFCLKMFYKLRLHVA